MSGLFFSTVIVVGIFIFLFFPIFLEGDLHYDKNRKKFAFSVNLFKIIKIFGGYLTTYEEGLVWHKNENNAVLLPYQNLNKEGKKFSILKTFQFISFRATVECGAEYYFFCGLIEKLYSFVRANSQKLENTSLEIWLVGGDGLKGSANFVTFFNGFILTVDFIQFLWGKIRRLWQRKVKKSTI